MRFAAYESRRETQSGFGRDAESNPVGKALSTRHGRRVPYAGLVKTLPASVAKERGGGWGGFGRGVIFFTLSSIAAKASSYLWGFEYERSVATWVP